MLQVHTLSENKQGLPTSNHLTPAHLSMAIVMHNSTIILKVDLILIFSVAAMMHDVMQNIGWSQKHADTCLSKHPWQTIILDIEHTYT